MPNNFPDNGEEAVRPHSRRLGREIAMQFLFSCDARCEIPGAAGFDVFCETAKDVFQLQDNRLTRRSCELAVQLYQLVTLHRDELDNIISPHCKNWAWDRLSSVDRNIMRIALAEMLYSDVPAVVCIDEAVEIARDYSGAEPGNYINGVLNTIKNTDLPKLNKTAEA